jgi:hypothetical protein|eukprot:CAMPEP_0174289116 /NCGR_PEP_ID=MMETSP0809-20121228/23691_1 /TAXON_ID=73025 ORGANISM="Eutreptiella gymnastica-like, Strain CCMP1594" /NCGR_SAMPLE_ID=MMETSP0809 /ASSEMBLY_ACC=CAM_ASM_000658 /LENGTH=275 /DNA_ID=CAMNT_0015386851 /DNA_START=23 /DNA_END=850 /DNA_ORIENTATION=+
MSRWFICLFVALLLLDVLVFAQDDEEEIQNIPDEPADAMEGDDEYENLPPVSAVTIFPEFADRRFPSGVTVEALIGFQNNNENAFHVEYIRGSLIIPTSQFTYQYLQNFSGAMYNTTVGSGDEASLLYRFMADPSIGPSEYGLVIELYYSNDDNETYLATVYNGTVVVTDSEAPLDAKFLFAGTIILGLAGAGAFYVYGKVNKTGKKSHAPRARKEEKEAAAAAAPDTVKDGIDWDFIPKDLHPDGKKKNTSPTRRTSPSRKGKGGSSPTRRPSD